jgi:hypothetical protein
MEFMLHRWQLYFVMLAGWMNRQQQEVIQYPRTENRVLKEKFSRKRTLLDNDQRRRLAVKGMVQGRKRVNNVPLRRFAPLGTDGTSTDHSLPSISTSDDTLKVPFSLALHVVPAR